MGKNNNEILHNYLSNIKLDIHLVCGGLYNHKCEGDMVIPPTNRLYYIYDGQCKFIINKEVYYPKRGSLILVPKGTPMLFGCIGGQQFKRYTCQFSADFGNCSLFELFKFPYIVDAENDHGMGFLQFLFEDLARNNGINDIPAAFKMQATLMKLISCFVDGSTKTCQGIQINKEKSLRPVVIYIEKNYRNDITIRELADYAHLHPNYFIKAFKKQFGMPPIQYINKLRLAKAKFTLTSTTSTVQEIAVDCGFNGQSQFSKAFKQMYGISPSVYRKKYTNYVEK